MIEPKPPPSRIARTSLKKASSLSLFAPPEKITIRLPLKELCTTWLTRCDKVSIGM